MLEFVHAALCAGASRTEVARALSEAGWSDHQIRDALSRYAEVDFVVPVPRPRTEVSARDAFVYVVTFGALYLSAYHFGNLLFQFVDLAFPSELGDLPTTAYRNIRWALAALIIAFPVYLYLSYRTARALTADPPRRTSAVRRWLIYLTLTLAAFVVIGDLISLVYSLLSGELTARFVLKSAVVGLIAGAIYGYYFWAVRSDDAALGR